LADEIAMPITVCCRFRKFWPPIPEILANAAALMFMGQNDHRKSDGVV
jgi:hypothetical protein